MSWSNMGGYSPTMLKKPASMAAVAMGDDINLQQQSEEEVVVPLVLWTEPPQVQISCIHVLQLPMIQPSQNSSTVMSRWPSFTQQQQQSSSKHMKRSSAINQSHINNSKGSYYLERRRSSPSGRAIAENDLDSLELEFVEGDDEEDTLYQICVFAGTMDGVILYWLFEQDTVVQVNLLVMSDDESNSDGSYSPATSEPVQSIISGIDEWGQSTMISVTRDGGLAQWQLPNGICSSAKRTLAKELAPIKGMEMFCNKRYAMVFSEQTRMMVLDTWKMTLLYCMDTSQEQIRRCIAVGELKMPTFRASISNVAKVAASSTSNMARVTSVESPRDTSVVNSLANSSSPVASTASTSFVGHLSNSGGTLNNRPFIQASTGVQQLYLPQIWDSVVISLGGEGLVKCFLWSKPRAGSNTASVGATSSAASSLSGFQWLQESCWVLSWADDAEDITCSQSTSLKDGDNMNPQTALMRSIKSSYFPIAVHLSPDSSLMLFIWKTKWVILKRKWLCNIESLTSSGNSLGSKKSLSKSKANVLVGSCKIPPAVFLSRTTSGGHVNANNDNNEPVNWENGMFVGDNQVILLTNTGHVLQFATCGNSMSSGGKLFIFTKDQDQFVPRSNFKNLTVIDNGQVIAYTNQCECCLNKKAFPGRSQHGRNPGFTSCVVTMPPQSASSGSTLLSSTIRLVHVCQRGSLGLWSLPMNKCSSPPRNPKSYTLPGKVYEHTKFYSLTGGFQRARDSGTALPSGVDERRRRRVTLSHLILGREDTRSSCIYDDIHRDCFRQRRRRRCDFIQGNPDTGLTNEPNSVNAAAAMATNALSTALGPLNIQFFPAVSPQELKQSSLGATGGSATSADYLMDVPLIAKGYSDGTVGFSLLYKALDLTSPYPGDEVCVSCHTSEVTAIAHCQWVIGSLSISSVFSSLTRDSTSSQTTTSEANKWKKSGVTSKRAVPVEELCLATEKNPFYRSRFPSPTPRRSWSSRHLSLKGVTNQMPMRASVSAPSSPKKNGSTKERTSTSPVGLYFMVFTGGKDGVMKVIEVSLRPVDSTFSCEALVLQQFRKHRGPVADLVISPLYQDRDCWSSTYPDRLVASVGQDHKVILYAPTYSSHPNSRGSNSGLNGRCDVKWECLFQLGEHPDTISGLDWHLERGLLYVECADHMVYVWNTDTGILERSIPTALVYDGGNGEADSKTTRELSSKPSVETTRLLIGDSSAYLLKFWIIRSAEHVKKRWRAYYYALSTADSTVFSEVPTSPSSTVSKSHSPYALGSIELHMLSYLLSWGASPEIDRACRELLGIQAPKLLSSCALRDPISGALTIPIPWITSEPPKTGSAPTMLVAPSVNSLSFTRNWQHSSALSANLALGIVSLCMNLMEHKYTSTTQQSTDSSVDDDALSFMPPSSPRNKEEFHVLWSQLITQHSVVLPDYVPNFREPALESLAKFGFHSCDYTQLAARTLLNGVIKRLSPASRSILTAEYSTKLHCEIVRLEMITGCKINGSSGNTMDFSLVVAKLGSLVILLSMMGTCFPGEISPAGAREVCDILVYLLRAPSQSVASVSAELLTKGLMLFRPHLVDLTSLISQLLFIDMREKQRNPSGGSTPTFSIYARVLANGGSNAALSLLVELGAYESAFVLGHLQQEMNNNDRPHAFRECVLLYLTELINTHYLLMFRHLPAVVDTIMCCLDPTKLERRKRCLELSTRCLHNLVRRFPMVDFHKDTQRLALGTMEAVIVIYDLRTATKWRVLDGHTSAVSAIAFRMDGQILVSYAAREGSVRWWNSGNAGLFGGMLKMQQSCLKEHKLEVLKTVANAPSSSGGASADLKQVIQTCRLQFLTLKETPTSPAAIGKSKEKKILRLTREDASQVQFLM